MTTTIEAPAHVPPALFWDHDPNVFAQEMDDPFLAISRLHDGPDIIWAAQAGRAKRGAWLATRHALVQEIFLDPVRFSSLDSSGVQTQLGVDWKLLPLEVDPPEHGDYRLILQPWFQPAAIKAMEAGMRRGAEEIIASFEDRDGCEFISEFAQLFPSYVILELMNLPRDMLPTFLKWESAFIHAKSIDERAVAVRKIASYMADFLEERRRGPRRDDVIQAILEAQIRGRPLTQAEIMGLTMILYTGGLDTVLSSLGWYFRYLATDQALQARLRENPQDIPQVVDELLRAYGVVGRPRTVTQDMVFHGVEMKKGDVVMAPGWLAGRDPHQYPDPHRIDPDRKPRHLTLATGPHNCVGSHLAKREIKIVLEAFLSRFENIRLAPGETASWQTTGVWSVTRLPLVWDRIQA